MANTVKYLDYTGLQTLVNKIKENYIKKGQGKAVSDTLVKITTNQDGIVTATSEVSYINDITKLPGFVDNDTKNTAGTTNNSTSKLFVVGAPSQGANPVTYSNANVYIGTDNELYSNGKKVAHYEDVAKAVVFRGSLGTNGTITALPTASSDTEGDMYKVITAGSYGPSGSTIAADVGDLFICALKSSSTSEYEWVLIPSGDEPSGTVTSVATGQGLSGGPITSSGTISHVSIGTADTNKKVRSFSVDGMGHVTGYTNITATDSSGAHTHTVTGKVTVPTITSASANYNVHTEASSAFVKSYPGVIQKLVTSTFTPAANLTSGFPTRTVFGTNTTASKVSISSATASKASIKDDTAVIGNANVGTSVSIIPAVSNGSVVPAVAIASGSRPTKTVYSSVTASKATAGTAVTYGNANVGTAAAVAVNVSTVSSPVSGTKYAYDATYDGDTETLTLTPLSLNTAAIKQATASTTTLTPYTFADVTCSNITGNSEIECAKAGTAVSVAKAGTAVSFTPAAASSRVLEDIVSFSDVSASVVSASDVSVPVVSSNTDVTVAKAGTAITYATGTLSTSGSGGSVLTGLGTATTGTAIGSVTFRANTTGEAGGVALVNAVTVGSESKDLTNGTAASNGAHTHTIG